MKTVMKTVIVIGFIIQYCFLALANARNKLYIGSRRQYPEGQYSTEPTKNNNSNILDEFLGSQDGRRKNTEIWPWDVWCQLQPLMGNNCARELKKYYYDKQLDECSPFSYTGCKSNKNNFDNLMKCERYCKGAAYTVIVHEDRNIICSLQPDAGVCLGYTENYYFDANAQECKRFGYGGCGGNQNRFETIRSCQQFCLQGDQSNNEDKEDVEEDVNERSASSTGKKKLKTYGDGEGYDEWETASKDQEEDTERESDQGN